MAAIHFFDTDTSISSIAGLRSIVGEQRMTFSNHHGYSTTTWLGGAVYMLSWFCQFTAVPFYTRSTRTLCLVESLPPYSRDLIPTL